MCASELLLIAVHHTAEMGMVSVEKLIEASEDDAFTEKLNDSHETYKRVWMAADTLLKARGGDDGGISDMAKVMSDISIDLATLTDGSTERLLGLLLKGNERGLAELDEALSECACSADEEALNLAAVLRGKLTAERSDIERALSEEARRGASPARSAQERRPRA